MTCSSYRRHLVGAIVRFSHLTTSPAHVLCVKIYGLRWIPSEDFFSFLHFAQFVVYLKGSLNMATCIMCWHLLTLLQPPVCIVSVLPPTLTLFQTTCKPVIIVKNCINSCCQLCLCCAAVCRTLLCKTCVLFISFLFRIYFTCNCLYASTFQCVLPVSHMSLKR